MNGLWPVFVVRSFLGLATLSIALAPASVVAGFTGWTYSVASDGLSSQITRTTDGSNWIVQDTAAGHLQAIAFANLQSGWAALNGSPNLLHTSDGGATWTTINTGVGTAGFLGIAAVDSQNVWAVGFNSALAHTTNGGATWVAQNPQFNGDGAYYAIQFVDLKNGWLVGDNAIEHSTNGGLTWTMQLSTTSFHGLFFSNLLNGWAIGANNVLFHTTNGGTTWSSESTGLSGSANLEGIDFVNANVGWIVAAGGQILKSTNGGLNWTTQFTASTSLLGVSFADSLNGWAVGLNGTVLRTADGGATWNPQAPGTVDPFIDGVVFPAATVVPEPSAILLAAIGAALAALLAR